MIGPGSIFKRAAQAAKRMRARGIILVYHRIAPMQNDPWRLIVTPENFADQLKTLRASGLRIVHVSQFAREVAERRTVAGTVAISFDDGYADNLSEARPLLERFSVPATLFAVSGYIGSDEEFWWDTLERVFLLPGELPRTLHIDVPAGRRDFALGADAKLTPAEAARHERWEAFTEPPTARHQVHDELWSLLVSLEPPQRSRVIAQILSWARQESQARPSHRILSQDELRRLARDQLVEIGAHSVNHPGLGMMPAGVRRHELEGSKAQLEQMLGRPVYGMSYPQGRSSTAVQREALAAGYLFACGSIKEAVTARSSLSHLPRVAARNCNGARLRSLIEQHLGV